MNDYKMCSSRDDKVSFFTKQYHVCVLLCMVLMFLSVKQPIIVEVEVFVIWNYD